MKYFFFLFFSLLLAACTSDDDLAPRPDETPLEALNRLVPITQSGGGTFGCLVNGELWIPEVDGASDVAADALVGISNPFNLSITVRKEPITDTRNQSFIIGSIFMENVNSRMKASSFYQDRNALGECVIIDIDTSISNFILVDVYNDSSQVISGRFQCTMREPDCPDTKIEITDGRFDLRYRF